MTPEYIVVHTAAFNGRNCDRDRIDSWHRQRGWREIGYHFVILNDRHDHKPDGTVENGRSKHIQGAHALGINSRSLGICCVGHGDYEDFTPAQYQSLYTLTKSLMQEFSIPVDKVIGHRELNDLVDKGVLSSRYHTSKSCPGKKIDMNLIRSQLVAPALEETELPSVVTTESDKQKLLAAIHTLHEFTDVFPNAKNELLEFLYHPEVMEFSDSDKD